MAKVLGPDDPFFRRRVPVRGDFARAWDRGFFEVMVQPTPFALLYNTMQICDGSMLSHSATLFPLCHGGRGGEREGGGCFLMVLCITTEEAMTSSLPCRLMAAFTLHPNSCKH